VCSYQVGKRDTGRRSTYTKNGRTYTSTIWEYKWRASCGASGGPYTAQADAATAGIAHKNACAK